nr:hypothetical protein BaRGS_026899 [Batillaria attramentaria]
MMGESVRDSVTEAYESMTTSSNGTYYDLIKQPVYMTAVLSLAYGLVFVVTLAGNLCVVGVVYRDKHFHTPTYMFIVNLAVADLAVAIFCLPVTLLSNLYNAEDLSCLEGVYRKDMKDRRK